MEGGKVPLKDDEPIAGFEPEKNPLPLTDPPGVLAWCIEEGRELDEKDALGLCIPGLGDGIIGEPNAGRYGEVVVDPGENVCARGVLV